MPTVVAPREILIDGKTAGTISLIVWGDAQRTQYDLVVEQPVASLQQQLQALFPGEAIQVSVSDNATILSGNVSSTNVMLRAAEIAQASATKRAVINMLQVPGGSESQQVLLQVRFAEVNRRALQELGVSLFTSGRGTLEHLGPSSHAAIRGAGFDNMKSTKVGGEIDRAIRRGDVRRLSQSLLSECEVRRRRGDQGARELGAVSKPRRAEPDRV